MFNVIILSFVFTQNGTLRPFCGYVFWVYMQYYNSASQSSQFTSPAHSTEDYPHPLHMGVAIGKSAGVIRSLVMMFGVDKRDEQGRTPLMFAALANRVRHVV